MRSLPHDICRCLDGECSVSQSCLRLLLRSIIGERTPIVASLRESETECLSYEPVVPGEWIRWSGGRQPVADEAVVQVEYELPGDGNETTGVAKHFNWSHRSQDYWMNIVAFRVVGSE